jgi:hypothetical protein
MSDNMNAAELVDISTVAVDRNLPQKERIAEYKRQIKDPCRYKSGVFSITCVYPDNGICLEDCLREMTD